MASPQIKISSNYGSICKKSRVPHAAASIFKSENCTTLQKQNQTLFVKSKIMFSPGCPLCKPFQLVWLKCTNTQETMPEEDFCTLKRFLIRNLEALVYHSPNFRWWLFDPKNFDYSELKNSRTLLLAKGYSQFLTGWILQLSVCTCSGRRGLCKSNLASPRWLC